MRSRSEGGEVVERVDLGRPCFAAMLGGPDRRSPFMHGGMGRDREDRGRHQGENGTGARVVDTAAPGVGWP